MPIIDRFSFRRYKAFREAQKVDLAPLTLFYGYNNAGKSAAVRFLPGISASIQAGGDPLFLGDDGPFFGATFSEVAWDGGLEIAFTLGWGDDEAGWLLRHDLVRGVHWIDSLASKSGGNVQRLTAVPGGYQGTGVDAPRPIPFSGLLPWDPGLGIAWVDEIRRRADVLAAETAWVPGWRGRAERDPKVPSSLAITPRMTLSEATRAVVFDASRGDHALLESINAFYGALGATLSVRPPRDGRTALLIGHPGATPVNLLDAGEGMAQVLPVLTAIERARLGTQRVVCIEQPELHLHSRAQVALANRLVQAAQQDREPPTLLVETHSQHLMLAVQLAVVRGELSPDRLRIYWVRQGSDGASYLEPVRLDEAGRDTEGNWPPDVFTEDHKLARAIIEARRARGLR